MWEKRADKGAFIRSLHEFLFGLNIGLIWILERNLGSNSFWALRLQYKINAYLHLDAHSDVGAYAGSFSLALGIAVGIYLLLSVFARTVLATEILRSVAGIAALCALPGCWFYVLPVIRHPSIGMGKRFWLLAELGGAVSCVFLYLHRKWPIPSWGVVGLLVLHYSFWARMFFGLGVFLDPRYLVFPLAGLCSALAWGSYVDQTRRAAEIS
jgi:hypothetical protein